MTYDLNRLQRLGLPGPLCLTLNPSDEIRSSEIIQEYDFTHPAFTLDSIDAQRRFSEVSGRLGVSFCGAYWGYGFHEDGLKSALAVAESFGLGLDDLPRPICLDNADHSIFETTVGSQSTFDESWQSGDSDPRRESDAKASSGGVHA